MLKPSDPYVKVCLMCQGRRIKKRKTSVQRNTLNPVFNEALVFDVPQENVEDVYLLVKLVDYDRWVGGEAGWIRGIEKREGCTEKHNREWEKKRHKNTDRSSV